MMLTLRKLILGEDMNFYLGLLATLAGIKVRLPLDTPLGKLKLYLKVWYWKKTGEVLHLDNPKTFNEKIQWLKLYDSTPLKTKLADKYLVREWIKEKIGEEYLIPLLGVWDKFDDIDFDKLPDRFVLKGNHGCAYNYIVKDKSKMDIEDARKKFNKWMKRNYAQNGGLELHYKDIPPKIVAEAYIEDSNKELNDYKIMCFNGKPQYIWIDQGRFTNRTENIYNKKWELQPFLLSYPNSKEQVPPPENLDKMFELAEILAKDFSLVRVDFYNVDGKIYFGEMTFTSCSGVDKFIPSSYNRVWGDMLELPRQQLIVSLTSFPYRIPTVHLTIKSLLCQTMKPDKIILQLSEDEFPNKEGDLPENLLKLREEGLTISWNKGNIKSYKKLIPTLKQYPDAVIVTVDDDRIFDKNMIKDLWNSYLDNPEYIHCHRTTKMLLNKNNEFDAKAMQFYKEPSFANKLAGGAGCLYPPNTLYKDITNEELFTKLAPTNDDIWFWLMAVMNGTKIKLIKNAKNDPKEIKGIKKGPCLTQINDRGENLFYVDLNRVLDHYEGLKEKIISDIKN
mgnify:CR=1 FL=1